MAVYYVLLFVPAMIQHFTIGDHPVDHRRKNQKAIAFFFFLLTLLLILRHESVGSDTSNYLYFFKKFSQMSWGDVGNGMLEIGFSYFMKFISIFTDEPRIFLAISAITVSAMIYPAYKRLCADASLTIMLFTIMSTFVVMFSGIRQMLAVGMGFIAYEFTRRRKPLYFILMVCLAMTFHTSAFMLLFMYPIYHAKITKKWLYAVVPALIIIFMFNSQIFSFLTAIIEQFTSYKGGVSSTGAYTMIIMFGALTAFSFLIPDESLLDEETIGLRNFMLLSLVIQMFAPLHALAMRMSYYYIIFIPLLIPKIIVNRNARWNQVAVLGRYVMVAFFLAYFFLIKANSEGNLHVFPYHFFWENI